MAEPYWAPGTTIALREVIAGRVRSVRPLRVVVHDETGLAGYLVPESTVAWPRLVDESQSQTPDQGWRLPEERWFGPGSLYLLPARAAWAAVLFLDPATLEPQGWKIDFLAPPKRFAAGLDTLDWSLDLLVAPDRSEWLVKDADDLAQQVLLGRLDRDEVLAARRHAEAALERTAGVVGRRWDEWLAWRPDRSWAPLTLPAGWGETAAPSGSGREALTSGRGERALDGNGHVWLDLDLADGTLPCGHAHPEIVAAIARQAALGLGSAGRGRPQHEATRLLETRLATRFSSAGPVAWTASGEAALAVAVACATHLGGPALVVDPIELLLGGDTAVARVAGAVADGRVLIADERRGLTMGVAGGCAALGLAPRLTVVGESLFAGLNGGAVIGASQVRDASQSGQHPLLATIGLATLAALDQAQLVALAVGGTRLAQTWNTSSLGGVVALPDRSRLPSGVLVGTRGVAFLAAGVEEGTIADLINPC